MTCRGMLPSMAADVWQCDVAVALEDGALAGVTSVSLTCSRMVCSLGWRLCPWRARGWCARWGDVCVPVARARGWCARWGDVCVPDVLEDGVLAGVTSVSLTPRWSSRSAVKVSSAAVPVVCFSPAQRSVSVKAPRCWVDELLTCTRTYWRHSDEAQLRHSGQLLTVNWTDSIDSSHNTRRSYSIWNYTIVFLAYPRLHSFIHSTYTANNDRESTHCVQTAVNVGLLTRYHTLLHVNVSREFI